MSLDVSIVGSDAAARLELVKALDGAPGSWSLTLDRVPRRDADVVVCDRDASVTGAVTFRGDPDELIADIAAQSKRPARRVIVTSPDGGTGITSLTIHLAAELAARGSSPVVLDPGGGSARRLGLEPTDACEPIPVMGGFHVLSGDREAVSDTRFDWVIVDTPVAKVEAMERHNDLGVLLLRPSPVGARGVQTFLEEHPSTRWFVVANRVGPGGETTHLQLGRIVGASVRELACCPGLRDAEDDHRLVRRGWSRWSRGVSSLVDELVCV
ncbi:MAG: iron-transfer P-loop NTPase [Actinomycetota bacterium]|nr:iron-transfer P-loop NTPase [Actinomycetota bacterium]